MCRSGNLAKTVGFYKDVLGMSDVAVPELVPKRGSSMAAVSRLAMLGTDFTPLQWLRSDTDTVVLHLCYICATFVLFQSSFIYIMYQFPGC